MKLGHLLLSLCLLTTVTGCIPLLVTGGLAGGIVLSVDTARIDLDTTIDRAWEVTYQVLESKGEILSEDSAEGVIRARIQETSVIAYVARVTYDSGDTSVWVDISARRKALPHIDMAFEIINEIQGRI